ncbi:MAG TPA: FAD:protein FMN transferase [Gaiellaceae bacterium]|nr:FAD:protein FMN transferase [Gaiellaceae bacterium]
MTFRSMGCDVVVEGALAADARAVFERYDATFSRFRPDSELARLNRAGGGVMSPFFAEVLEQALWASRVTRGIVVPTVGRCVLAAGYDADFHSGLDRPEPAAHAAPGALRRVGRVLLLAPGTQIDLNGVVKSIAVDRAAALLRGDGFVSAGGDIATRGPVDVALTGGAVRVTGGIATSGVTRRQWLRGGVRQHHLIDPRSGLPSASPWSEVTVCGATCLDADVAAKAAFLLGEEGPSWLDELGLPGRFVSGASVFSNRHWKSACI